MAEEGGLTSLQGVLLAIVRASESAWRDELAALELTPAQAEALRFAGTIRPDVATVGQLARVLGVRHTTALGILQPLTERGLIERLVHPYSARQRVLALTGAGRSLLERIDAVESEVERALAGLSETDAAALKQGLGALTRGLAEKGAIVRPAPCRGCVFFEPDAEPEAESVHYCRLIRRYLTDGASRMLCPEHRGVAI